jgi:hypothetical protein
VIALGLTDGSADHTDLLASSRAIEVRLEAALGDAAEVAALGAGPVVERDVSSHGGEGLALQNALPGGIRLFLAQHDDVADARRSERSAVIVVVVLRRLRPSQDPPERDPRQRPIRELVAVPLREEGEDARTPREGLGLDRGHSSILFRRLEVAAVELLLHHERRDLDRQDVGDK